MNYNSKYRSILILSIIASLTLGLAPFFPEPHIIGKLRWIAGGAHDMKAMDYFDTLMHGFPFLLFIYSVVGIVLEKRNKNKMDIQTILKDPRVILIDVREPIEFERHSLINAINMPLSRFETYLEEINKMKGPKILFCRVGSRSAQAVSILKSNGIDDAHNGGGLKQMEYFTIPSLT